MSSTVIDPETASLGTGSMSRLVRPAQLQQDHTHDVALDAPALLLDNENARTVRRNWFNNSRISRLSKLMVLITTFMSATQLLSSIVVLALSAGDTCDQPLRLFISVYMVRVIFVYPLTIYQHLHPAHRRQNVPERTPRELYTMTVVDRIKSTADLFGMLWFVIGNWFIFSSVSCYRTSPTQFYLSLAFLVLGYFIITLPLFLCGAVIFCLPLVITVMRVLRIADPTSPDAHNGATEEVISKIPIVRYKSAIPPTPQPLSTADSSLSMENIIQPLVQSQHQHSSSATTATSSTRWNPLKWFKRRKANNKTGAISADDGSAMVDLSAIEPELVLQQSDALCVICLTEYEDGDRLRQLRCSHHFHMTCVDEWLRINKSCPLCVRDVEPAPASTSTTSDPNPSS
ncbi:hypothetical protein SmJEL517_g05487 [Synchytrium microbalum]|uniref:RING-type domain-containing protein n=1 Tax=Synchytrium microbalum TaxID=1806994 RepID=A0A507BNS4_9FUNG|nr:uncharacterized protein SmJEL517_g05487 [Synchytrium microbalum]TPX31097.1 hypothetical protein SmJEL517_g05487 [Synchytrium microbalum]